ncbi:MAG: hypothetical protein ACRDQ5_06545, partial [Sciscionella sp.]
PVLHDALLAPVLSVGALALSRWLAPSWRVPVVVGAVLSGVLALIAVPLLWREYGGALLPGLHDRDYVTGLLIWLAIIWVGVLVAGLLRHRSARAKPAE